MEQSLVALEETHLKAQVEDSIAARQQSRRGQYLGFVIAIAFITASLWLGLARDAIAGGILAGATLVAVVGLIVTGERTRRAASEEEVQTKKKAPRGASNP